MAIKQVGKPPSSLPDGFAVQFNVMPCELKYVSTRFQRFMFEEMLRKPFHDDIMYNAILEEYPYNIQLVFESIQVHEMRS